MNNQNHEKVPQQPKVTKRAISLVDYYSNPRFFGGNVLQAANFRLFIEIGQQNCIGRELTEPEIQKMQKNYMKHCEKNNYTNQDYLDTLYTFDLYEAEVEKGESLSRDEKREIRKNLRKELKALSAKDISTHDIKDIRKRPFSEEAKNSSNLSSFVAGQFAHVQAQEQIKEGKIAFWDSQTQKKEVTKRKLVLKESYEDEMLAHLTYKPPMSAQTKKGFLKLAAFALSGAIAVTGISAIAKQKDYSNTTFEKAQEIGLDLDDLDLSTSFSEDQINKSLQLSNFEESDKPIIELVKAGGSQALYKDIQKNLTAYQTTIPTVEQEELLIRELQTLPEAIFLDKTITAYNEAHENDEHFYPVVSAQLNKHSDPDFADTYSVSLYDEFSSPYDGYPSGIYLNTTFFTKLASFYELDENIDKFAQEVLSTNDDFKNGEISEYQRAQAIPAHLKNVEKYLEKTMDFSTKKFKIAPKAFLSSNERLVVEGQDLEKLQEDDAR